MKTEAKAELVELWYTLVLHETDKAILFLTPNERETWIPKSVIASIDDDAGVIKYYDHFTPKLKKRHIEPSIEEFEDFELLNG